MTGETSVLRSILASLFIIAMISAAALQDSTGATNNGTSGLVLGCATVPNTCTSGNCEGDTCDPCPHDPFRC